MSVRCIVATLALVLAAPTLLFGQKGNEPPTGNRPAARPKASAGKPNFDKVGPQVGDQLPALDLRTMNDEPQLLSDAWKGGPALIVTSSFTCPKSRSRWPELKTIVDKYDEK